MPETGLISSSVSWKGKPDPPAKFEYLIVIQMGGKESYFLVQVILKGKVMASVASLVDNLFSAEQRICSSILA